MKWIAKFFLWLLSIAIPVFIAACYGPSVKYSKSGKIIDGQSRLGVQGIQVTCMVNGRVEDTAISEVNGDFIIWYNTPCDELHFKDVDGVSNGQHPDQTETFCKDCPSIDVELR